MEANTAPHAEYLSLRDRQSRLSALAAMTKAGSVLPLKLAEDLLALDLSLDEKQKLLEASGSTDKRAYEHFLTTHFNAPAQDLAALAVRLWSQKTDGLFWFRAYEVAKSPHVPQRLLFTILDHAVDAGGRLLVDEILAREGVEDLSPAFIGLLMIRAVQWDKDSPRLARLAETALRGLETTHAAETKHIPAALAYAARYHPQEIERLVSARVIAEPWRDVLRAMALTLADSDRTLGRLEKLADKPPKTKVAQKWVREMPPVWLRHKIDARIVGIALEAYQAEADSDATRNGQGILGLTARLAVEPFGGIPEATLKTALSGIASDVAFARSLANVYGLLARPLDSVFVESLKTRARNTPDPAAYLAALPLTLRLELTGDQSALKAEETAVVGKKAVIERASFFDQTEAKNPESAARRQFFDAAYRGVKSTTAVKDNSFWSHLLDAWNSPDEHKLNSLAQAARQVDGVFRLAYLDTLGRFKGFDQAALKTLDFVRSKEEDDLRAVVHALDGIGTQRAVQELVSTLTRPNVTAPLSLEICTILARHDVSHLQNELRSAISDLTARQTKPAAAAEVREVCDAIQGLLTPGSGRGQNPQGRAKDSGNAASNAGSSDQDLDHALSGKIPHYRELSSEVKRALRTSQYFHTQVSHDSAPESIDLSPVIDMQYKALELLFREMFEESCSRLISRGILQRRLDVIGYARPVPRAMDDFEAYLEKLPVIREIPFFSKFKLRKLLRAICQFRPGKRFTLDGLKAFALFFLCFSRRECRHGLSDLFPMGFTDDQALFDFVKELHVLQDFRNRAAHEGFHPDASSDIDGIWRATAGIVQVGFKVKTYISNLEAQEFAPKNRSAPIIEKKVS